MTANFSGLGEDGDFTAPRISTEGKCCFVKLIIDLS
jgi:hypothetical protein